MALLVVPLAPDEVGLLTLAEWDALGERDRAYLERANHPVAERLRALGLDVSPLDRDPDPACAHCALIADPDSTRVVDLARRGAIVTAGPASPPDALTAAHAAPVARRAAASVGTLAAIMARLRSDDGCPWDRRQSHESLVTHLLEESYEVIDSIERGDVAAPLEEELGDLLLQVAFHARLAAQEGRFDLAGVADVISAKLLRRHPHVFGDVAVGGAAEVVANWEAIKASEKERADPFDDIPASLPALLEAAKTLKRAAGLGFDEADAEGARRALADALDEAEAGREDGIGRALFLLVGLARARGLDPEAALRRTTREFRDARRVEAAGPASP
jgi:MazG family protein